MRGSGRVDKPLPELIEGWARVMYEFDGYSMNRFLTEHAKLSAAAVDAIGTIENLTSRLPLSFMHTFLTRSLVSPSATYWEMAGGSRELPYRLAPGLRDDLRMDRRAVRIEHTARGVRRRDGHREGQHRVGLQAAGPGRDLRGGRRDHHDSVLRAAPRGDRPGSLLHEAARDDRASLRLGDQGAAGVPQALVGVHRAGLEARARLPLPPRIPQPRDGRRLGHRQRQPVHLLSLAPGARAATAASCLPATPGPTTPPAGTRWTTPNATATRCEGCRRCTGDRIEEFYTGRGQTQSWLRNRYAFGEAAVFTPGQMTEIHPAIAGPEGRLHFAGEHTSLKHAWIEGALESAVRTALEVNG